MVNTKLLAKTEYASLGLSVLGTIAAAATGQAALAATPLTLALSLNLFNRQELAKGTQHNKNNISYLKQEFSRDINTLLKERVNDLEVNFSNLPVEKELINLTQIEQAIASLSQQLNSLGKQFNNRLEPREIEEIKDKLNWLVTHQEFNQICEQIQALASSFDFNSLEEKITEIGASLKNFATSESLISLADRLDILVEQFKNRAELENFEKIRERLSELEPVTEQLEEFKAQLAQQLIALKLRLDNLSAPSEPIDLTEIERAIATIESQLVTLKPIPEQIAQFQSELSLLEDLDASAADLHDYTLHLKRELENQKIQLDNQTQQLLIVPQQIEQTIQSFNQLIKETQPAYKYELVFDRDGSREVLIEALRTAQERLILVCPWITYHGADYEVMELCRKFLDKGGILEIGWGHLSDTSLNEHKPISQDDFLEEAGAKKNTNFWYEQKLTEFKQLQQQYPSQIYLKLLGTHEKFLVCDRTFAMIGSHNFLTSGFNTTERELGIRTNNKNIIEDLIRRFETAPCLDKNELSERSRRIPA